MIERENCTNRFGKFVDFIDNVYTLKVHFKFEENHKDIYPLKFDLKI